MINFGRKYSALRLVKTIIFTKLFIPQFLKRAAARHPQFVVFSSDVIGQGINFYGYWEYEELTVLSAWLNENMPRGGIMLDVGANIGNHSVFLSEHFDAIHALEPNPRTFAVLAMNASLASNVYCHKIGASDVNGSLTFLQEQENVGHSRIVETGIYDNTISVDCWRLDDYFTGPEHISLVKIDVEGHEVRAIAGMEEILSRFSPLVVFEQDVGAFEDGKSAVIELLKKNGYTEFYSIDRIPSMRRSGLFGKVWLYLYSIAMGFRLEVTRHHTLEPAFYEMLIARKASPTSS